MKLTSLIFIAMVCIACRHHTTVEISDTNLKAVSIRYAKGFSIDDYGAYKVLTVKHPWPDAKTTYRYLLRPKTATEVFPKHNYDGIISYPVNRIVVTSTTHIPALELLNEEKHLVGFPGTNYISALKTRQRINDGKVRDLGNNDAINTEVLLELNPDVVMGFGIDGANKRFETIKKVGIPVIYNGDWVEASPLAKAEWIKCFGVLFDKTQQADSIFKHIEQQYKAATEIAKQATHTPTVFSGAMHNDMWYLPNGQSSEAQFFKDANAYYLWHNTKGKGSLALSFETVLERANDADLWLNPSYYSSYAQLKEASLLYTHFDAYKQKQIYSFANTKGATGGVLYYEQGVSRPDLVLKDIINVCHPQLLKDYTPHFYKPIED